VTQITVTVYKIAQTCPPFHPARRLEPVFFEADDYRLCRRLTTVLGAGSDCLTRVESGDAETC
jgi:hypothetical protein